MKAFVAVLGTLTLLGCLASVGLADEAKTAKARTGAKANAKDENMTPAQMRMRMNRLRESLKLAQGAKKPDETKIADLKQRVETLQQQIDKPEPPKAGPHGQGMGGQGMGGQGMGGQGMGGQGRGGQGMGGQGGGMGQGGPCMGGGSMGSGMGRGGPGMGGGMGRGGPGMGGRGGPGAGRGGR